ncbi:MAG TPA: CoA transferase, partial [Acidimicrobiales bacterium]|nr:CoA transferase [Acidimicrobiales bacterium]
EVEDPEHGTVTMPGVPIRPEGGRPDLRGRRWIGAGCDGGIDWQSPPPEPRAAAGAGPASEERRSRQGPLAGYRILDLGTILAGPYAGSLLAQLGAEVVKVEPVTGDPFRARGFMYNRGLRSLAVDLRDRRGLDAFRKLAASSDVVVDNFRNGVAARLGVDRAHLRDVHPELVTVSISGFGDRGPLAEAPGFDPILQAMSGMMRAQGGPGEPVFVTTPVNDVGAAVCGALAACLGLFDRLTSGRGRSLRTSLLSLATLLQADEVVTWPGCGPGPRGGPDFAGRSPLRRYYRVADGWIRLEAEPSGRRDLEQLVVGTAPGGPGLNDAELERGLAARLESLRRDEAATLLRGPGRVAVAVRTLEDLVADGGPLELHRPPAGSAFYTAGRLVALDRTQEQGPFVAPGLGEHSRAVLAAAGMAPGAIDALVEAGVVAEGSPMVIGDFAAYR